MYSRHTLIFLYKLHYANRNGTQGKSQYRKKPVLLNSLQSYFRNHFTYCLSNIFWNSILINLPLAFDCILVMMIDRISSLLSSRSASTPALKKIYTTNVSKIVRVEADFVNVILTSSPQNVFHKNVFSEYFSEDIFQPKYVTVKRRKTKSFNCHCIANLGVTNLVERKIKFNMSQNSLRSFLAVDNICHFGSSQNLIAESK